MIDVVSDLDTPAVTVDLDIVECNIHRTQERLARHGIHNRPHIKTHKIPALAKMQVTAGAATWDDCAMRVRATVVSRPTPTRAILDTGSKVLTYDQYYVKGYGRIVEYPNAMITSLSEEHGIVDLSQSERAPEIGEIVNVIPNHCCAVTNMMDEVYAIRGGKVDMILPVAARGKVR